MTNLDLTDEERDVLSEVLQGALTTLEVEVHRADPIEYKKQLKHRCEVIRGLLLKMSQPVPGAI